MNKKVMNTVKKWSLKKPFLKRAAFLSAVALGLTSASCSHAQDGLPNQVATPSQVGAPTGSPQWTGPSFSEFSGVNQAGGAPGQLLGDAISWNRMDLSWGTVEPEKGVWKQEVLEQWGKKVLEFQAQGVHLLPVLDYTADWAADVSAREYNQGDSRWKVKPRDDGQFDIEHSQKQPDGTYKLLDTRINGNKDISKWPPAQITDWENYVRRVVTFLHQAPYNVDYFQIWNEAHPSSGFWSGSMDEYMEKIHFPATRVIHELGAKVVYGGWPDMATIQAFPPFLDKYKAWNSIDVVDFHYFFAPDMEYMRKAADERGKEDLPIWQTEIAFTRDYGFVGNNYPRMLFWALGNNWDHKDKYKLFFFPYWSPNDPQAYGYGRALVYGSELSPHGQSLQTLTNLLQGPNLRRFDGVTTSPQLVFKPSESDNSLECFAVQNRVVAAVHLDKETYAATSTISLSFPIASKQMVSIERVDLSGKHLDLTPQLVNRGMRSEIQVPVKDAQDAPSKEWNEKSDHSRTFYVVLTQAELKAPR